MFLFDIVDEVDDLDDLGTWLLLQVDAAISDPKARYALSSSVIFNIIR